MVRETWNGTEEDLRKLGAMMQHFEGRDPMESLIPLLHHVQDEYRYIPEGAAEIISDRWHIPMTDIFGVVTFYADFTAEPLGRNRMSICEGAACYFMGATDLAAAALDALNIQYNETTPDGAWTISRADFCYGACHLAPLVEVNHKISGPLTAEQVAEIVRHSPANEH